jgi:uncharacterized protein (DUF983 family)
MYGVAGARRSTANSVIDPKIPEGQPGIAKAALFGLCPKCSAKTMFGGLVKFAARCDTCGLDYSSFNVGDGPAAFLTMGVGTLVILLALLLDIAFRPPFWVHLIIWVPFTVAAVIGSLRVAKAALLVSEYRNRAGEGTS